MKGFAVFLAVLGLCAVLAVAGGVFLFRTLKEPVKAELQRISDDVAQYSATHEQSDCAPEALGRLAACDRAVWCSIQAPVFAKQCLRRAKHSADLCDDVPKSFVESVTWPSQQCVDIDVDPQMCTRILNEVVRTCAVRRR